MTQKNNLAKEKKLIRMFHASTFIFPNMKRSNSDRCTQLQGVCKVWKGKVSPKADLNYGFLMLSYLNKSIRLIFPQEKRKRTIWEESPLVPWSKTTLQNLQVNHHKNKSTFLE